MFYSFMFIEVLCKLLMSPVFVSKFTKVSGITEDLDMIDPFSFPSLASRPFGLSTHIFVLFIKCFPWGWNSEYYFVIYFLFVSVQIPFFTSSFGNS